VSSRDEPIAPLGLYHPKGRCHRCGDDRDLTMVIVRATRAWGWQCDDPIACARRFTRRRQLELFDDAA
jgi:hypothetical protein